MIYNARVTGGDYIHSSNIDSFYDIFLAEEDEELWADTDDDGIADYYEKLVNNGTMRLGNGVPLWNSPEAEMLSWANPDNQDSDGDGLMDGAELQVEYKQATFSEPAKVYMKMSSNPCLADTDGDGYLDGEDSRDGRSPVRWDLKVINMDDDHVIFNTGHEWKRINCTAQYYYNGSGMGISLEHYPLAEDNSRQKFTADEIVFLAPYNLEGLKVYFDSTNDIALREQAYKKLFGKDSHYAKKVSSNPLDPWEEVSGYGNKYYDFFFGKVVSDADMVFTYYRGEAKYDFDDIVHFWLRPFADGVDSLDYVIQGRVDDSNSYYFGFMVGLDNSTFFGLTSWTQGYSQEYIAELLQDDTDFRAGYMMGSGTGSVAMITVFTMATDYFLEQLAESLAGGGGSTGMPDNANYAQTDYRLRFSREGIKKYTDLVGGTPIETIDDLVAALNNGSIHPSQIDVAYIIRDGNPLILNTRTSQALTQAGIPRSAWNAVNLTGDAFFERSLTDQLLRNKLTSEGIPTVFWNGKY